MRIPGWLFIVGILALVLGTAICSVVSFTFARKAAVDLGNSGVQVASFNDFLQGQPTATPSPTAMPPTATTRPGDTPVPTIAPPTATLDPLAQYVIQDPRRINILLMGIDQRKGETGEFNTDTLIVFSVDPVRKTVGMLSIPRDLWVDIPGFQPSRINTANRLGEIERLSRRRPGAGSGNRHPEHRHQDRQIRADQLRRVHHAHQRRRAQRGAGLPDAGNRRPELPRRGLRLHPRPFRRWLPDARRDPSAAICAHPPHAKLGLRPGAAPAGSHQGGARNRPQRRRDCQPDRASAAALRLSLADSYKTNLTLPEILSLGNPGDANSQREYPFSGQIGPAQTSPATAMLGGISSDVLILNHAAIRDLLGQVFDPPDNLSLAELRQRAEAENASIVVFNNTTISGLAGQTRDWLASRQVTITDLGNIPEPNNAPTTIRNYKNKPWTARYLAQLLGLGEDRIQTGADNLTQADVMVVAGPDVQPLLSGTQTP